MEYFKKIVLSTSGLIGSVLNKEIGFKNKGFRLSEVLLETSLILWIQHILKRLWKCQLISRDPLSDKTNYFFSPCTADHCRIHGKLSLGWPLTWMHDSQRYQYIRLDCSARLYWWNFFTVPLSYERQQFIR